jgi:hypothetical protein
MSRASSARAAGFVGALARSHTTDTNIQGERSDLPTKMTPHEIFSLNRMDGQLWINYYADQDRETAVHPMLIPPFPVDRIRTAVDHTFFDML